MVASYFFTTSSKSQKLFLAAFGFRIRVQIHKQFLFLKKYFFFAKCSKLFFLLFQVKKEVIKKKKKKKCAKRYRMIFFSQKRKKETLISQKKNFVSLQPHLLLQKNRCLALLSRSKNLLKLSRRLGQVCKNLIKSGKH